MKKYSAFLLVLGAVLLLFGLYQEIQHRTNSAYVTATITEVKTDESDMGDVGGDQYTTYYGEYVINGTHYTDRKLDSHSGKAKYKVGDTLSISVDGSRNGNVSLSGEGSIVMGAILLFLSRKKKESDS